MKYSNVMFAKTPQVTVQRFAITKQRVIKKQGIENNSPYLVLP